MYSFICAKKHNKQNSEETTNMYEGYACIPPTPQNTSTPHNHKPLKKIKSFVTAWLTTYVDGKLHK
jgi:hypothetical protein